MNFTVLANLTKPMMRGSNLRQCFLSTYFQLLNLVPHTKTFFIHHHSFSSHNSSLLLRHAHKGFHFLLRVKRLRHHGNPVQNALQNRIPTTVRYETTCRRMSRNLLLRGPHGAHNPHRFRSFHEPLGQVIQRHVRTNVHPSFHSLSYSFPDKDPSVLHRVLQRCRVSTDLKTATKTHARVVVLGFATYPSLVASLISTYAQCHQPHIALHVFSSVLDLFSMNLVIESLMKGGQCDIAKKVFGKMSVRDVVTWNSMIGGYVRNSRFFHALSIFRRMLSAKVEPDGFTFASVVTACARLGALGNAKWVHGLMVEKRVELNYILSAALIDMYAKCGRIDVSRQVFEEVARDHVSVWNAMISGLAIHGLAMDATMVFSRMEMEHVLPDSITFIGILTACSHCGLVEEGRKYFGMMQNRFMIQPQLEHYGTMVDLLGRAGLMEEAYAVIKEMPMEPDIVIWRALLSACRIHRKKELGEVAIANISSLESGDFVLLSNMYCSLNNWDGAERVRRMMKTGGVRKSSGKSWVELGDGIHQFNAAYQSHAEMKSIYRVLEGLVQRAKLEGFTPLTDLVLMDVSEEEKEENLMFHSEKLAMAYAVLKTSPGTKIRISKNLRICLDCHNWIKIVSKILNRKIIVRDRIRFHQFEGGVCSCRDYW